MPRLSFIIGAIIGLGALSASTYAQDLILEETEGGYIIVNWEDTVVTDYLPEETDIAVPVPPVIETSNNNDNGFLSKKSKKANKKNKTVFKKSSKK